MILVTGTKRSGTSMWMQALRAAGLAIIGEAFPRDWGRTIREANREGFFESSLRRGIYHATNPSPRSGVYYAPDATRHTVVKVFVPGLVRSDLAFVQRVVATMRSLREYVPSLERLYAMELRNKARAAHAAGRTALPSIEHMPPGLEWWHDNVRLLSDSALRRYPLRLTSYAAVLAQPALVSDVVEWLGVGDGQAAARAVRPAMCTQSEVELDPERVGLPHAAMRAADEIYWRVHEGIPLDSQFRAHLGRLSATLAPAIRLAEARIKDSRRRLRALRAARRAERHARAAHSSTR